MVDNGCETGDDWMAAGKNNTKKNKKKIKSDKAKKMKKKDEKKHEKKDEFNIIITGVGGQGVMTLGSLLSLAAMMEGKYTMTSELHGLAKRFGHTEFHLRIGNIKTTIVPNKSADIVIALEPLETKPLIKYCNKEKTKIYTDDIQIKPTKMDIENISYPSLEDLKADLKPHAKEFKVYPASKETKKIAGDPMYSNIYLLGKILKEKAIPINSKTIIKIIEERYGKDNINIKVLKEAMKENRKK